MVPRRLVPTPRPPPPRETLLETIVRQPNLELFETSQSTRERPRAKVLQCHIRRDVMMRSVRRLRGVQFGGWGEVGIGGGWQAKWLGDGSCQRGDRGCQDRRFYYLCYYLWNTVLHI